LLWSWACFAQSINVGSFNIRMETNKDIGNLWIDRAPAVTSLIRFHDFDIFGTQEGFKSQLDDISAALPQYARYGAGRDDGKEKGEHSTIYFKKDEFVLLDKGDFWLSETPDKPSLGWDATCCNRICSWVYLEHKKSKKKFYFFNVHFDHQGVIARVESSKLILRKIQEIAKGRPAVLAGDFNGSQDSELYKILDNSTLLNDTYKLAAHPYALNGSYNGFGRSTQNADIIDHIFVTKDFNVNRWGILSDSYNGKFPSDHFPVLSEIKF
jgi:endonuclease/exonuclease/phosphatase family metal-dependent hydrolase